MFLVTLKWVGSQKVLNQFDFDFDQPGAQFYLQNEAAKALGCKTNAARVKYINPDLNLNLDLAVFPRDGCAPGVDRYERMNQAWSAFQTALTNVKALETEATKPSVALHATLFSQEMLWIEECSKDLFYSTMFAGMPAKARASRRIALAAVTSDSTSFRYASPALQADRAFVLACCQRNCYVLEMVCASFQADREIVLAAVQKNGYTLKYASSSLRADKEVVLAAVRSNSSAIISSVLEFVCASLKADREIVLAAVQGHGYALRHASLSVRADKEVVLAAVTRDCEPFKYASPALQADRAFVLACCQRKGYVLEYVCASFQADREIVLAAVQQQGYALKYASLSLRADKEVVLAAVRSNGFAIVHASLDLRADDEVRAAANWPQIDRTSALKWVGSNKVLNHFDFDFDQPGACDLLQIKAAKAIGCETNAARVKYINPDLNLNLDLAIFPRNSCAPGVDRYKRMNQAWSVFQTALANARALNTEAARPSIELHATVFSQEMLWIDECSSCILNASMFAKMPAKARASRRVALAAVTSHSASFKYASPALQADRAFVLDCCRRNGFVLEYVCAVFQADREIVLTAVKQHGIALQFASFSLTSDKDVVLAAVRHTGSAIISAASALRADNEVRAAANLPHLRSQQLQTSASGILKQAQSKGSTTKMFSVTLKWVGSQKVLNHFDCDFDQPGACDLLQSKAAKAIGCETNAARVKYINPDLNLNLDLAVFPRDGIVSSSTKYRYERLHQAWSTFRTELKNVKALKTNAEKPSIALHVTLFSRELLWIDTIYSRIGFNSSCFKEMPAKARASCRVALAAVTLDNISFKYASLVLQADRAFVLESCRRNGFVLAFVCASFQADREIVLAAVKQHGHALQYASLSLRADRDVVLAAVRHTSTAIVFAASSLQADIEVKAEKAASELRFLCRYGAS